MSAWKITSGILSILFGILAVYVASVYVLVQALSGETLTGGGIWGGILMFVGGIVSIATNKSEGSGGAVAVFILFGISAICEFQAGLWMEDDGLHYITAYALLGAWDFICAVIGLVDATAPARYNSPNSARTYEQHDYSKPERRGDSTKGVAIFTLAFIFILLALCVYLAK